MQHIEICIVFFLDNLTEFLLNLSGDILILILLNSSFSEQLAAFLEGQHQWFIQELELFEAIDILNSLDLILELFSQANENVVEKLANDLEDLHVGFLDFHLKIESNKLTHVSMSEGFLSPEYVADFKDFFEVTHDGHLFVELRGLCKTCLLSKVVKVEDL